MYVQDSIETMRTAIVARPIASCYTYTRVAVYSTDS